MSGNGNAKPKSIFCGRKLKPLSKTVATTTIKTDAAAVVASATQGDNDDDEVFGSKAASKRVSKTRVAVDVNEEMKELLKSVREMEQDESSSGTIELVTPEPQDLDPDIDELFNKPISQSKVKPRLESSVKPGKNGTPKRGRSNSRGRGKRKTTRSTSRNNKLSKVADDLLKNYLDDSEVLLVHTGDTDSDEDLVCLDPHLESKERCELIEVKFNIRGSVHKVPMKRMANFWTVIEVLAEELSAPTSELALSHQDKEISFDETPDKLKISVTDFIDCFRKKSVSTVVSGNATEAVDPNSIKVKIRNPQRAKGDQLIVIAVSKLGKFSELKKAYSEKVGIALSKLVFEFDGEVLEDSDTPESLEMEDDSLVDVKIRA